MSETVDATQATLKEEVPSFTLSIVADTCGQNNWFFSSLVTVFKNSLKQLKGQYDKVKDKYPCKVRSQIVYFSNYVSFF